VEKGDTLSGIAKRFGCSTQDLVEANEEYYPSLRQDPASLRTGWLLTIPAGGE
jgi:murein DD-endopeptidase MepM/ murein hydrolase activator NlpD